MNYKTKQELIEFENEIIKLWEDANIPYPVHICGGNEEQLIEIFKDIKEEDWCFSTHRAHYHYLLKGGSTEKLKELILKGDSMHIFDKKLNFFTSAIVAGCPAIAAGLALALKRKGSKQRVFVFCGDGCEDEGHFYEAVRYVDCQDLPCTFIIEDNELSVETPKIARWGKQNTIQWPKCVQRYYYSRKWPHVGTDKWINFSGQKAGGNSF